MALDPEFTDYLHLVDDPVNPRTFKNVTLSQVNFLLTEVGEDGASFDSRYLRKDSAADQVVVGLVAFPANGFKVGSNQIYAFGGRVGIGRTPSVYPLEVQGDVYSTGSFRGDGSLLTGITVPVAAAPTAQVGLTTVNGSAATFMRSDAAPPLNQGITPTWTNPHTFTAGATFNSNVLFDNAANWTWSKGRGFIGTYGTPGAYDGSDYSQLHLFNTVTNPNLAGHQTGLTIWQYINTATNTSTTQDVYGIRIELADLPGSTGNIFGIQGIRPYVVHLATSTMTQLLGWNGRIRNQQTLGTMWAMNNSLENTGTITGNAYGYRTVLSNSATISGSVYFNSVEFGSLGTVTGNIYGYYCQDLGSHARGWNVYSDGGTSRNYFGGSVGIGTTTLTYPLNVTGNVNITGNYLVSGSPLLAFAAPTALVGLTAVPGSAGTVMRSDAAPALDTNITVTWGGVHTFGAAKIITPDIGASAGQRHTVPAVASDTIALLAASQALTNKTYNGLTVTATTGSFTLTNAKTLTVQNSIIINAASDGFTATFPASGTSAMGAATLTVSTTNAVNSANHTHAITTTTVGAISTIISTDGSGQTTLASLLASGTTFNLANSTATTINLGGAATSINIGAVTGTFTVNNPTINLNASAIATNSSSLNLFNSTVTTLNFAGAATSLNIGNSGGTATFNSGTVSLAGTLLGAVTGYNTNIGQINKKFLTLHAAELWVETLVAQNTVATIGGRIIVAPTNILVVDLSAVATTITVKYNNFSNGDRVYMEANGSFEVMAITSAAGGSAGAYTYTVTRNLDGSGANAWSAGDALVNTGTTGSGHIDIYSIQGVKSGLPGAPATSQAGPTMVGNVRTGSGFNSWNEHWAIGNLQGLYGYGSATWGAAFGEYASGKTHVTIDSTFGYRTFSGLSTLVQQIDISGNISVGQTGAGFPNVYITSTGLDLRVGSTIRQHFDTNGSGWLANTLISWDSSGNLTVAGNASIAGWTVSATYFAKDTGTAATSAGMSPTDYPFWAGQTYASRASAPFRVTTAGAMTATSGSIGGWGIASDRIAYDTGTDATSAGMAPADWPFYAGTTFANRTTAPFRVSPAGALTASNATITGTVTASAGTIAGWVLSSTSLTSSTTVIASGQDVPANGTTHAWFGRGATGYVGWRAQDSSNRRIESMANNSGINPYLYIHDGTRYRILLGGLNNAWNGENSGTFGMKLWNTAGSKLLEFSDSQNMIASWAITTTTLSSGNITIASNLTPPFVNGTPMLYLGKFTSPANIYGLYLKGTSGVDGNLGIAINDGLGTGNRPYIYIYDGSIYRVVIGELNTTAWNGTAASNSMGMRVFDTTGAVIVEFSSVVNMIANWRINTTQLYYDTGTNATSAGLSPTDYPFYAGATIANRATAPFRVTNAGALVATSATITGAITATSGSFTGTVSIASGGSLTAGGGTAVLDNTGISVVQTTTYADARSYMIKHSDGSVLATLGGYADGSDNIVRLLVNPYVSRSSRLYFHTNAASGITSEIELKAMQAAAERSKFVISGSGTMAFYSLGTLATSFAGSLLQQFGTFNLQTGTGENASVDQIKFKTSNTTYTTSGHISANYDRTYLFHNAYFNGSAWVADDTGKASAGIHIFAGAADGYVAFFTSSTNNGGEGTQRMVIGKTGLIRFNAYGAGTLVTDASGNITASSDERMKIELGSFETGYEVLKDIKPIVFKWKAGFGLDTFNAYVGFAAGRVRRVLPLAVGIDRMNGMLTLQDRTIMAVCVNSIKSLYEEVKLLKSQTNNSFLFASRIDEHDIEIKNLKAEIDALKVRVAALEGKPGQSTQPKSPK